MSHTRLSPSARHRWAHCPGSVREAAKYPDIIGEAAIDGTHTHTLLEHCISNWVQPQTMCLEKLTDEYGEFVIDQDRIDRVQVAFRYVVYDHDSISHGKSRVVHSERRVDPKAYIGRDDMAGTLDISIQWADKLEIIDYKDGFNIVEVRDNEQLEVYALGALASMDDAGLKTIKTIVMTIIQPNAVINGGHAISSVSMPIDDFYAIVAEIKAQAAATDDPNAPLVAGEKQCRYCPAAGACSARAAWLLYSAGVAFQPISQTPPSPVFDIVALPQASQEVTARVETMPTALAALDPAQLTNEQITRILELEPVIKSWLEDVGEHALVRMKGGVNIPGLKLVRGRGSREWKTPEEKLVPTLKRMGVPKDHLYKTSLVTVAALEKVVWTDKENVTQRLSKEQLAKLDAHIETKAGKLTVALASDKRDGVMVDASSMFQPITSSAAAPAPVAPPPGLQPIPEPRLDEAWPFPQPAPAFADVPTPAPAPSTPALPSWLS